MPPQDAETALASGTGKPGSSGSPVSTSSSPALDKMATPFHWACPWTANA